MNSNIAKPALLIATLLLTSSVVWGTELNQQTLDAWNQHIQSVNTQMQQRLSGALPYFWIDQIPGGRDRLRQGEILAAPTAGDSPLKVPHGLIHDWVGAVFIPNMTIDKITKVLNEFDRYNQIYNPAVIKAKLLEDSGQDKRFSMLLVEKAPFVTAAYDTEYSSRTKRVNEGRAYTISYSTRIQQIDKYGEDGEHELPADTGDGFLWRLYSIERFEQTDGGVIAEFEALALSRDIPFQLGWLVKPIIHHLPRNSMLATLQKTRDAFCPNKVQEDQRLANSKLSSLGSGMAKSFITIGAKSENGASPGLR